MTTLDACAACGWVGRPRRIRCPRCGADCWQAYDAVPGTVAAVTRLHRGGAVDAGEPVEVVLVRLRDAEYVIALAHAPLASGDPVRVVPGEGCLEARPER